MPKEETVKEDLTEGNWNVAGDYVKQKILKYLVQVDFFYELAIFGCNDIYGDVFLKDENFRKTARLLAVKRLIHTIITLLRNSKFSIHPKDQPSFQKYDERLLKIEKNLFQLRHDIKQRGKLVIQINEDLFDKIINEIMATIMDDVNFKLNKAGFIFTQKEEYNVKEQMKKFQERIENI